MKNPLQMADAPSNPHDKLGRQLGPIDGTFLVVSSVVGVGIFFTPGTVAHLIPDPRWFLFAWALGAVLSFAGATANAELGTMFPRAGGDYVYLREAFHPTLGFLAGWLSFFAIFAGTVATLASAFGQGLVEMLGLGQGLQLSASLAVVAATTWVNYVGLRAGARLNNLTGALKVVLIAAFAILGFWAPQSMAAIDITPSQTPTLEGFLLAMSPIIFTYLGWNAPVYVASEIRKPDRTLPRALFWGLLLCAGVYLLLNFLYVRVVPMEDLGQAVNAGELVAVTVFGDIGGRIVSALILVSILGCLNATILVGPRIAYAMALDGNFFSGTDRVHSSNRTPHIALVAQALVAIGILLILRNFPSILDYTTFAVLLATIGDTLALYALRRNRPDAPRPYRAWGYPWVPGLYLVATTAIALGLLIGRPLECFIGLLVTATGLPFLWFFSRRSPTES